MANDATHAASDRANSVSYARNADGTFGSGPGNPGKQRGTRHRFNAEVLAHLGGLTTKAMATLERKIDEGDLKAATFVLSRFLPSERSIALGTSEPNAVADAIADGELTVTEANRLALAINSLKAAAGLDEMRARLDEVEKLLVLQRRGD